MWIFGKFLQRSQLLKNDNRKFQEKCISFSEIIKLWRKVAKLFRVKFHSRREWFFTRREQSFHSNWNFHSKKCLVKFSENFKWIRICPKVISREDLIFNKVYQSWKILFVKKSIILYFVWGGNYHSGENSL